jgi:hypothetical protein
MNDKETRFGGETKMLNNEGLCENERLAMKMPKKTKNWREDSCRRYAIDGRLEREESEDKPRYI